MKVTVRPLTSARGAEVDGVDLAGALESRRALGQPVRQHIALNDDGGQRREMHRVTICGDRPRGV